MRRLSSGALASAAARPQSAADQPGNLNIYFGDLHNHSNLGYAQGSLRRVFEIARNHLDFFALTPHAHWHDIRHFEGAIEDKWINGFAVTKARWPEVLKMAKEFDASGKFAAMVGYEWHSTSLGDYHLVFPAQRGTVHTRRFEGTAALRQKARVHHDPASSRAAARPPRREFLHARSKRLAAEHRRCAREFARFGQLAEISPERFLTGRSSVTVSFVEGSPRIFSTWAFHIRVDGGTLDAVETCFLPGPLEEERRDRIVEHNERGVRCASRSTTARKRPSANAGDTEPRLC